MKKTGYLRNDKLIAQFGQRIRQLRLEKQFSQADLAHATNFSFTYISKIENGNVNTSISHLSALANALDIPLDQLLKFPEKSK